MDQTTICLGIILPVLCLRFSRNDPEPKVIIDYMMSLCVIYVWLVATWLSLVSLAKRRYRDRYRGLGLACCICGLCMGLYELFFAMEDPSRVTWPSIEMLIGMAMCGIYNGWFLEVKSSIRLGVCQLYPPPPPPLSPWQPMGEQQQPYPPPPRIFLDSTFQTESFLPPSDHRPASSRRGSLPPPPPPPGSPLLVHDRVLPPPRIFLDSIFQISESFLPPSDRPSTSQESPRLVGDHVLESEYRVDMNRLIYDPSPSPSLVRRRSSSTVANDTPANRNQ